MKLPNAEFAFIDIQKLIGYCLSQQHATGKHKARLFASVLGLTAEHAEVLRNAILEAVTQVEAVPGKHDNYGQRYTVDFEMVAVSKSATVRTSCIVRTAEDFPRLTSCYIL